MNQIKQFFYALTITLACAPLQAPKSPPLSPTNSAASKGSSHSLDRSESAVRTGLRTEAKVEKPFSLRYNSARRSTPLVSHAKAPILVKPALLLARAAANLRALAIT